MYRRTIATELENDLCRSVAQSSVSLKSLIMICKLLSVGAAVLFAAAVCPIAAVSGQTKDPRFVRDSSALHFDGKTHDFGAVREEDGKVSHTFRFRNTGDEPIVILSASSSCGCTVPVYTREPVLPNDEGRIEITFDPANRVGSFDKEVTLTTSERTLPVKLRITGDVMPRKRTVEELYPIFIGDGLRLEDNFHAFGYVEHGKSACTAVGFVNTSDKRLKLRIEVSPSSGCLKADYPAIVGPHAKGEIDLAYILPAESRVYGTLNDVLNFAIDGRRSEAFLSVTGIAVDNRDDMADNCAPKAELMKNIVKFGVVKRRGKALTEHFTIENTGEAPLVVRAVECRNAGLKLSLRAGDTIGAGEKSDVAVTLQPSHCEYGRVAERVRVITNDPLRPMREIRVTAIIEE